MNTSTIVQKLWNYCNVLRDDGMSYGDYPGSSPGQADTEQLTYLLFLKMADERTKAPYNQKSPVPSMYSWPKALTPTLSRRERENFMMATSCSITTANSGAFWFHE